MNQEPAHRNAEEAARRGYGKLVALLASRSGDLAGAEDALSDAFVAALADWPLSGCPANPEAWLLTVARRRMIDAARRRVTGESAAARWQAIADDLRAVEAQDELPDRRLGLMFACAHPAIDAGVRAPLMLQAVVGLDAATIASAFLVSPMAMSKRLVRAKDKIRQAGIPFRVPARDDLPGRLDAVLDAVYAAFTEGWTDPFGADPVRRELTGESLFLARLMVELLPDEPETLGLLSLMLHAEARRPARRNADGEYVPLAAQDPSVWAWPLIADAETLLRRAAALAVVGRFQVEAAIQSAHVHRRCTGAADWAAVLRLYDTLLAITGSPVVAINRAVAVAEVSGAAAGLDALDAAAADPRLVQYQPYWAARADLLSRTGATIEARRAYELAIGLERDPAVRRFLQNRQSALSG